MGWIFIKNYYESSENEYRALVKTGPNFLPTRKHPSGANQLLAIAKQGVVPIR